MATRLLPPSKMQGYAYLGLGNVLERRGKAEQAVQAFRASEKADPSSYKAVVSVGRLMQTMDHPQAEVQQVYRQAVKRGALLNEWQHPSQLLPDLTAAAWYQPARFRAVHVLEEAYPLIRSEVTEAMGLIEQEGMADTEGLTKAGKWVELNLFFHGRRFDKNIAVLPRTAALINTLLPEATGMVMGATKLSIMKPGTRIEAHSGTTNARARIHMGVIIPAGASKYSGMKVGNVTRMWEEGKCLVFDDSFEHEVWYDGTGIRAVLIVDVWHPEMDEMKRLASIVDDRVKTETYQYHKQQYKNWFNTSVDKVADETLRQVKEIMTPDDIDL